MLLLYNALFSLLIAVPSGFAFVSSGHEIQVRIPVWNVGNIFSDLVKGHPSSTRRPTRPTRSTTSTKPTPSTKPTGPNGDICDLYPHLPACLEEVTPEPSICDQFPQLPLCQGETSTPEPSICDQFPQLPLCQGESSTPEPSICDQFPQLPLCQEETSTPEPSICDQFPQLPLCQEVRSAGNSKPLRWRTDSNFCQYYPNSCSSPEEPPFVPLVDGQRRSLLLILPGARGKKMRASGRSSSEWLGPTRRPAWQRQSKKDTLQSNQNK